MTDCHKQSSDLVARLRAGHIHPDGPVGGYILPPAIQVEAADEIDRLNRSISDSALQVDHLERTRAVVERELAEAQRERDEARGAAVKANRTVERLHGLLREMKLAMLGYPMSMRALSSTALLVAINKELEAQK